MFKSLLAFACIVSPFAEAFIPPLNALVREAVEGRRSQPFYELVIRHRVEARPGEVVEIEEQWAGDSHRAVVLFKVPGGQVITAANFERRQYLFPSGMKVVSTSSIVPKYLMSSSADDLLGTLVNERFVRRDHLTQFKQGFEPKGDPQTWEVKEYYIQQEGVSMRRVKSQATYAFWGGSGDDNQSVFFQKEGTGIRRLEWRRGSEALAWNFDGHTRFQSAGTFPKYMEFERGTQTAVSSELLVHRPAKEKQVAELRKWQKTAPPPNGTYEEALKILLSYR